MYKKIIVIIFLLVLVMQNIVYADVMDNVSDELNLNSLLDSLEEYAPALDIYSMEEGLKSGEGIDYGKIGNLVIDTLFKEIRTNIKTLIQVLVIIVLMAIIKSIELDSDSTISKFVNLVGFVVIVSMLLKNYIVVLESFKTAIKNTTTIVEIISPFMLAILIATGKIATSGITNTILLFVTSIIGTTINYVVIPLLTLSIVFKIITNMTDVVKLDKLGKLCNSTSILILSIIFAIFLGILELETSVTTSVDDVTVKVAQTAISNVIPVVGKFVSDSIEVVLGATEVIGKSLGVIGVIVIVMTVISPLFKLLSYSIIYSVIEAFSEALLADSKITNVISMFKEQYKVILGILFGVMNTFIIAIGIVISILGKVSGT